MKAQTRQKLLDAWNALRVGNTRMKGERIYKPAIAELSKLLWPKNTRKSL